MVEVQSDGWRLYSKLVICISALIAPRHRRINMQLNTKNIYLPDD